MAIAFLFPVVPLFTLQFSAIQTNEMLLIRKKQQKKDNETFKQVSISKHLMI